MRGVTVCFIVCALLVAATATAGKIGFVNAELAATQVDEGQAKFAELRAWQDPRQGELDRLRDRVMALRQQLANAQGTATPEELSSIERNELDARRGFEDARREYERELEQKTSQFLAEIAAKIGEIGSEYAEANDYDAVFLTTAQPMVYVSEAADLTPLIVELYNQRYPVSDQ
jgi:Skp family chaperone for outer membrane proteins